LFKAPAFTLLFSAFSLLLPIAFPVIGFRKKGKKARQHWAFRENTFPRGLLFPFFPVFFPVIGEIRPETGSPVTAYTATQSAPFGAFSAGSDFSRHFKDMDGAKPRERQ
jgi:hypothetical protein